jgi:hypothetical protein
MSWYFISNLHRLSGSPIVATVLVTTAGQSAAELLAAIALLIGLGIGFVDRVLKLLIAVLSFSSCSNRIHAHGSNPPK